MQDDEFVGQLPALLGGPLDGIGGLMLDLHNAGHCVTRGADGGEGATGGIVVDGDGGGDTVQ